MNHEQQTLRTHVIQGEFMVSNNPNIVLCTILGSCVAACIRDPEAGVGGMNHFLLPGDAAQTGSEAKRYGVHLMELLINGLLKAGAQRKRLEAKIIGGASTMINFSDIGRQNAVFAEKFLGDEGIRIVGLNVGGNNGRKLEYWPVSGRARQIPLNGAETQKTVAREQTIRKPVVHKPASETVEFF